MIDIWRIEKKVFLSRNVTAIKMWETRIKYAIKMSNEKRKMAGEDINVYRKKKQKVNVIGDEEFSVNMEHLVKWSATYKPKRIGPAKLGVNETVTKAATDSDFSTCMEHSAKTSATYKPKRSREPAKKGIKQPIKLKQIRSTKSPKKSRREICYSHQPSKNCKDEVKNNYIQKKRTAKAYLCEQLVKKKRRSKLVSATKRKFEKSFPLIIKLIDGDRGKKKIRVGSKTNADVNVKLKSLKRKVEADTSLLHKYEKRRNYDFIKNRAGGQLDFRES